MGKNREGVLAAKVFFLGGSKGNSFMSLEGQKKSTKGRRRWRGEKKLIGVTMCWRVDSNEIPKVVMR